MSLSLPPPLDYSATERTTVFRHSVHEKAEFLKDFLKTINVPKIDMLVTHSSACYPGLKLWKDDDGPEVKSIALINASGHRRIRAMKPAWFIDGSVHVYMNPVGRWIYRKIAPIVFKAMNVPVKIENIDNVLLSATTVYHSEVQNLPTYLEAVKDRQVPLLFVFSENDKLVESKVFYEMTEMLDAKESHFARFDKEGNLEKECKCESLGADKKLPKPI